jgi:Y-X(10)_GDL-associated radical SAM protein
MHKPVRTRYSQDFRKHIPVHVVWEITLACNLKCQHCGSRAGKPRPEELSTQECLDLIDSFARLGVREVNLIGGEAHLRKDLILLIQAMSNHRIECYIQTGGLGFSQPLLEACIAAGLKGIGLSIDGPERLHDKIRGVSGSYRSAIDLLVRSKACGLRTAVNTQIGPQTPELLPELMEDLIAAGVKVWRFVLTVAMGNAVDHSEDLLLQPYQLLELMPQLFALHQAGKKRGLRVIPSNNVGYFGPYEHHWRSPEDSRVHWRGCSAGQTAIGIEADGTIKGCPSLPTVDYAGGNIRDLTLEQIWQTSDAIHFGRLRSLDDLWGFCRTCYYADVCRAGCTWTSHSLLGRPGNNPYCHYRVIELAKVGLQERIVKQKEAANAPFATGVFDLITEAIPGQEVLPQSQRPEPRRLPPSHHEGRVPPVLGLCPACKCYLWKDEETCPHCGSEQLPTPITQGSKAYV